MTTRAMCTFDELAHMYKQVRVDDGGDGRYGTVEVVHPTRLHAQFVKTNLEEHHNTLLKSEDLGDGWTRVVYQLGGPK